MSDAALDVFRVQLVIWLDIPNPDLLGSANFLAFLEYIIRVRILGLVAALRLQSVCHRFLPLSRCRLCTSRLANGAVDKSREYKLSPDS